MSDSPATPEAAATPAPPAASADTTATPPGASAGSEKKSELGEALKEQDLSIRSLLEAGVHFGHQPGRWNPLMKPFIFGERNGTHILDLDQTLPMLKDALDFLRETTAAGGTVLFVGTKRQAAGPIMTEAKRAGQYYINNRWLGGMLTNWKTVKKSIDRYNQYIEILGSEEKRAELSKKELASMTRQVEKYDKSLAGIRSMQRPPDAIFIIDVGKEAIAVSEGSRLHIPIIGIVDTNCSPRKIDFVVPGNDDAIRAIDLFCTAAANACREGFEKHQAELVAQKKNAPERTKSRSDSAPKTGRRVVEIKQQPRRGRGQGAAGGGKPYSAGGDKPAGGAKSAGGAKTAGGAKGEDAKPKAAAPAATETKPAAVEAPAATPTAVATSTAVATPAANAEGEKKE